jgi:uncharacterized protein (TIGR02217 family)
MQQDSEQCLELNYDYQSTATYSMRGNRMPIINSGAIGNISQYSIKGKWQVGNRKVVRAELDYLQAFWRARRGSLQRFRLKDWGDFATTYNGINDQGLLGSGTGNGVLTQFQLIKRYQSGGDSQDRIIIKPVAATVQVYVNGALQANGWTVNTATGIVTFAVAPANGAVLRSSFEFDVRVKFSGDLGRTFVFYNVADDDAVYSLPGVAVEEV